MTAEPTEPAETPRPPRLTQAEIIRALLERGSHNSSSVALTRNAKGETQIEVIVRTDPDHGIPDVTTALAVAETAYDALGGKYPIGGAA